MLAQRAKIYSYLLLAPALLPLFYLEGTIYPMLFPKTIALRVFGILTVALFAYLVGSGHKFYWQRLRAWYALIPAGLLGIAYLASLTGLDFYHSFWSTFERGDGLLGLALCVLYFYLVVLSADEALLVRLLRVVAWVGSATAAYTCIQWFFLSLGVDLYPLIAQTTGRVGGTMGNAAFLAAYLGVTLFVTLGVVKDYRGNWRTLLYIGAALQVVAILLTATRGTMLAVVFAAVLALLHQAVRGTGVHKMWAMRGAIALGVLLLLFIVFRGALAESPIEPVRRLASISFTEGTVASRLFVWQNLLPEALKTPLLGIGAEHIDVPFNRTFDPTQITEEWFDRSHNAYLDYFVQFGIFGLLLYVALIVMALITTWRIAGNVKEHDPWRRYAEFLFLGFVVYAIQNIFVFDTGVTLWLFLALVALVCAKELGGAPAAFVFTGAKWVGGGVAVVLLVLLYPTVFQPFRANLRSNEAYLYQIENVERVRDATEAALALDTYADLELGYNAYYVYVETQLPYFTFKKQFEDLKYAWETAYTLLLANYERYPYDTRTVMYLILVLDGAPDGVAVDIELQKAALARALSLSPKRSAPWYSIANLAIREHNYGGAVETLDQYISLVPTLSEPHFVLAELYLELGNRAKAAEYAAKGKELYKSDLETARRAVLYYEKVLDLENAKFFLQEILNHEPENEAARADLDMILEHEQS